MAFSIDPQLCSRYRLSLKSRQRLHACAEAATLRTHHFAFPALGTMNQKL
jgi:hypothetical protein